MKLNNVISNVSLCQFIVQLNRSNLNMLDLSIPIGH